MTLRIFAHSRSGGSSSGRFAHRGARGELSRSRRSRQSQSVMRPLANPSGTLEGVTEFSHIVRNYVRRPRASERVRAVLLGGTRRSSLYTNQSCVSQCSKASLADLDRPASSNIDRSRRTSGSVEGDRASAAGHRECSSSNSCKLWCESPRGRPAAHSPRASENPGRGRVLSDFYRASRTRPRAIFRAFASTSLELGSALRSPLRIHKSPAGVNGREHAPRGALSHALRRADPNLSPVPVSRNRPPEHSCIHCSTHCSRMNRVLDDGCGWPRLVVGQSWTLPGRIVGGIQGHSLQPRKREPRGGRPRVHRGGPWFR